MTDSNVRSNFKGGLWSNFFRKSGQKWPFLDFLWKIRAKYPKSNQKMYILPKNLLWNEFYRVWGFHPCMAYPAEPCGTSSKWHFYLAFLPIFDVFLIFLGFWATLQAIKSTLNRDYIGRDKSFDLVRHVGRSVWSDIMFGDNEILGLRPYGLSLCNVQILFLYCDVNIFCWSIELG